jgi:type IV pilus assembly protein PilQ
MNRSRITLNRFTKALFVAFVVAVCAGTTMAAAPDQMNQIHAVDVVQRGGQTIISVKGTSRPMYTAFKLSTPRRLVLDLANSSVKGVPSLLEKSTELVGGVAVSEFTTGKVKVSRVMVNFRKEASYRVKVKGNTLIVTLSGGPQKTAASVRPASASKEQVISLANAEKRIEQAQKSADERVRQAQREADAQVRDAKREADARVAMAQKAAEKEIQEAIKKAQNEVARARTEAADARQEAATAKARIASAQKEVSAAQSVASDAEGRWRTARAEISKLKASQAHYDKKLKQAQKEAKLAQVHLDTLQKEQAKKARRSDEKIVVAEKNAASQVAELSRKVEEARKVAEKERKQRASLETRLVSLTAQLDSVKAEAAEATREKRKAMLAVEDMKISVKSAFMEKETARKQAERARLAQKQAEKAYRAANKKDRDYLYRKLQQRQQETVSARKRYVAAETRHQEIDSKLDKTLRALKIAERKSQRAEAARQEAEAKIATQRNSYEKKLAKLGDAVAAAEADARAAREAKKRVIVAHEAERARILKESQKWKDTAASRLRAAQDRVKEAEAATRDAQSKTDGVVARINAVTARLDDANRTIVDQKKRIAELEKQSEKATAEAKKAEVALTRALKRAEEVKKAALAEKKQAELNVAQLRKKAKKAIAAEQKARLEAAKSKANPAPSAPTAPIVQAKNAVSESAVKSSAVDKSDAEDSGNKKLTQEELRLQRLAELQQKYADVPEQSRAAKKAKLKRSPKKSLSAERKATEAAGNAIQDIKFVNKGASQKVVINGSGEFRYSKSEKNNRVMMMEFSNARLLPMLERTLDVRDFGGIIDSISSYRQDNKVRVEVKLGRHAANRVDVRDGSIEWLFTDNGATGKDSAAPLGSASRVVHREKNDAYAYPTERTAAYSVTLADLSQRKEKYTGRRIDLDFKNADIHNILRLLADVGQVNIITSEDVKGSVTIRMREVPWDQALDVILQTKGLGKVKQGNLIRVAPLAVLEAEYEKAIERIKMNKELKPLETRLIPVSYATAGELMPRAQDLLTDRGKLSVDSRTNVIIARDVAETLDQVEALIRNLDTQTPQVLIEGRIVEATSTFAREIGIQWGGDFAASSATGNPTGLGFPSSVGVAGGATDSNAPLAGLTPVAGGQPNPNFAVNLPAATGTGSGGALGISLGSISNNANLNLRLSAMEEEGTLRILSSPKILTLDNRQAHIEQGTMIPYSRVSASGVQTSFKEAKLNLTVTPHVTADGSVLLDINMTRDEPDFNNKGARGDPTILKREAKTELLVNDGHTAVIGGIFTRNHGRSYKKVPFFGDIPILGWLFKSRSDSDRRSEMLIFITPTIVNRAESIGQ